MAHIPPTGAPGRPLKFAQATSSAIGCAFAPDPSSDATCHPLAVLTNTALSTSCLEPGAVGVWYVVITSIPLIFRTSIVCRAPGLSFER